MTIRKYIKTERLMFSHKNRVEKEKRTSEAERREGKSVCVRERERV